jgi:heme-degrading monooxygenase HmoA
MTTRAIAPPFEPPYVAVIFTSEITDSAGEHYAEAARRMEALACEQPGYLGIDSLRSGSTGITISYWRDDASVRAWKREAEHVAAQSQGRKSWYERFHVRVAHVDRSYSFER